MDLQTHGVRKYPPHRHCWLHPPGLAGPQYPRNSDLMESVKRRRSFLSMWRFAWLLPATKTVSSGEPERDSARRRCRKPVRSG